MKKIIVLSVNENQDYCYFAPLTVWAWRKFGYDPLILYRGNMETDFIKMSLFDAMPVMCPVPVYSLDPIEGIRDATIAQVSRIFASSSWAFKSERYENDYIVTGDIDLIPLKDSLKPDFDDNNRVTAWNFDLTGRTEVPICHVGARAHIWWRMMHTYPYDTINEAIKENLQGNVNARSDDFYKWWGVDQQILTERVKAYPHVTYIDRGPSDIHGYARGRVDRAPGGWRFDLPELIDAHMEQQTHHSTAKIGRLFDLLRHVWPNENFDWFAQYTTEFRKITGHTG